MKKLNIFKPLVIGLLSLYCCVVSAANMGVMPLGLKLNDEKRNGIITINNLGRESILIKVATIAWTKEYNIHEYLPTSDLLVHPKLITIFPKKSKKIFVEVKQAKNIKTEQAYRLLLTEMPNFVKTSPSITEIQPQGLTTLLQFNLPVYVVPITPINIQQWHAQYNVNGNITLKLKNKGNVHIQINEIIVHQDIVFISSLSSQVNTVIFPEQSEHWEINLEPNNSVKVIRLEVKTATGVQNILLNVNSY